VAAICENRSCDFWREAKRLRCMRRGISSTVDVMTVSEDIADKFASEYKELYTSVTYMMLIKCKVYPAP